MTNTIPQELWRLAQVAFDEGRSPVEDLQIIELLLEAPELMETMDEVLEVEAKLGAISSLPADNVPELRTLPSRPTLSRARLGTVAAALLIACLPFVASQPDFSLSPDQASEPIVASFHGPDEAAAVIDTTQLVATGDSPRVRKTRPIPSFELSVTRTMATYYEPNKLQSPPSSPRPQIRTFTSTRTKIALGGRTR